MRPVGELLLCQQSQTTSLFKDNHHYHHCYHIIFIITINIIIIISLVIQI